MKFGSPEYFWLSLFGLTIIAGINSDSMILGLMSGAFGLVLSTIGMDPMEGVERFMFGQDALYNGVNITGALIGLFSLSQAFILAEKAIVKRARAAHFDDSIILTKVNSNRLHQRFCAAGSSATSSGSFPAPGFHCLLHGL